MTIIPQPFCFVITTETQQIYCQRLEERCHFEKL